MSEGTKTMKSQNQVSDPRPSILAGLHRGFNSFNEINMPLAKKSNIFRLKYSEHRQQKQKRSNRLNTSINEFGSSKFHLSNRSGMSKSFHNSFQRRQYASSEHRQSSRVQTENSVNFEETCPVLADTLKQNKYRLQKIKNEVDELRLIEFNDYIKKSLRYQELLELNDNKKKHLPTLNAKIGEVIKKSAAETQPKNLYYQISFNKVTLEDWKPESREGHSCITYKNSAIIIGGHCSHPFSTAHVYSFEKNNWVKQISTQSARSYHSSLIYKNRFIITFGGMGAYDVSRKSRSCYNSVNLIDLSNFTTRAMKMHNEDSIEARRSHAAVLMSKNMLVFGGMNAKKQYLNDLIYLDLKELRWYHKEYKIEGKDLNENLTTGITKLKAVACFKERKHLPLYLSDYAEHEGIYMFGGVFGNGQENIVLQMSFNKYTPSLKKVDYSGLPPSPIQPIVEKLGDMVVIISGDQKEREIRLFKPALRQFVTISDSSSKLLGGIGSSLSKHENKFYIFFGLGEEGYIGSISNFEIEQKLKEREIKKKKISKYHNGEIVDWRDSNWDLDSEASFM